jgi:hypothetical protein
VGILPSERKMPWLEAVGIPYLALIALAIIEGRGSLTWAQRFIRFGIDACVLGIGVCGAIFSNDTVQQHLGKHTTGIAVMCLLVSLILTGLCLHLREFPGIRETWRARLSIFLGLAILAINTEILRWTSS